MFVNQPNNPEQYIPEGSGYKMVNGKLRYFSEGQKRLKNGIPATWIKCDGCGKVAPAVPYNSGKFCSTDCAYANRKGRKHTNYKGRYVNSHGYVRLTHPETGGRMQEHRYVMEQHLGRKLYSWEHIHHKNGVRADNRVENLEVWCAKDRTHPTGIRAIDFMKQVWSTLSEEDKRKFLEELNG